MEILIRRISSKLAVPRGPSYYATQLLSYEKKQYHQRECNQYKFNRKTSTSVLIGSAVLGYGIYFVTTTCPKPGEYRKGLPDYAPADVAKHKTKRDRVWVTYKDGVYDVTNYLEEHPGGEDTLMQAAGGAVDPFWEQYTMHNNNPDVQEILESMRIGNLKRVTSEDPAFGSLCKPKEKSQHYSCEPERDARLVPLSERPYQGGPMPTSLLTEKFLTPNEICFVSNHYPVPEIDVGRYLLTVEITGGNIKTFTLDDLKAMDQKIVSATLQCGSNRSFEVAEQFQSYLQGTAWKHNAICNVDWTGVLLLDVLKEAGFDPNCECNQHVQFESVIGPTGVYTTSVPMWRIKNEKCEVILAYAMNGVPLTRDHGFPLRVIVPGVTGARWVKWLDKIRLQEKECDSEWHRQHCKILGPSITGPNILSGVVESAPTLQELPVISAICSPTHRQSIKVKGGEMEIDGYAWSGGGQKIIRVDVSIDYGKTWAPAKITCDEGTSPPYHFTWALWTIKVPVPKGKKCLEIWAKATDSSCNTQPENHYWNFAGVACNAIHKIRVLLE